MTLSDFSSTSATARGGLGANWRTARKARWTLGTWLAVIAGFLFVISMAPGLFGGGSLLTYGWRAGLFVLLLGALIEARGLYFDRYTLSVFAPWCLMLVLFAIFSVFEQEVTLLTARTLVLVTFVSALIGMSAVAEQGRDYMRPFFGAVFVGLILVLLSTMFELLSGGWSWDVGRLAKARFQLSGEFSANSALYILVLCAFFLFNGSWRILAPILAAIVLASFLLATRTPILAAILALAVVAFWSTIKRLTGQSKQGVLPILFGAILVVGSICISVCAALINSPAISRALAGRSNLWVSALDNWLTAPVFGTGPISVSESVTLSYSLLNFSTHWEFDSLLTLSGGGFHSVWFQTLVVFGIVGFLVLTWSFLHLCIDALSARRSGGLVLIVVFVIFRSHLEYSGLFANPNSPIDFLSALAVFHAAMSARRTARLSRAS